MTRLLLLAAALLALVPLAPAVLAQPGQQTATLAVDVAPDGSETMLLTFAGLSRGTEYRGICLPARADLLSITDGQGDVPHEARQEQERLSLTFRPRTETVEIRMERGPSGEGAPPLHKASVNFCTTPHSRVDITVRVAGGMELFFASRGGEVDGRSARWTTVGPTYVTYAYEGALDAASGLVRVDVTPFRIFAPAEREAQAREVAAIAAPAFARAAREAGLGVPWSPLRVHFDAEDEYSWEAGHYGGDGIVAVKRSTLDPDPREGYPYVPAKVLVHEAFHAASAPYGKGSVADGIAWWLEGSARHAERQVDVELPDATRHCETTGAQVQCWFFDDRVSREQLDLAYSSGFTFDTRWEPGLSQTEDARRFSYAYSAYVVAAYIEQAGLAAYRAAWADVQRAFVDDDACPCEEGWLEALLLAEAGNLTRADLYRPWAHMRTGEPGAFDARVASLVQTEPRVEMPPFFGLPIPAAGAAGVAGALAAAALLALTRSPRRRAP